MSSGRGQTKKNDIGSEETVRAGKRRVPCYSRSRRGTNKSVGVGISLGGKRPTRFGKCKKAIRGVREKGEKKTIKGGSPIPGESDCASYTRKGTIPMTTGEKMRGKGSEEIAFVLCRWGKKSTLPQKGGISGVPA